jgi:hypothetical protein
MNESLFSWSTDTQIFHGNCRSREEAIQKALKKELVKANPSESIWICKRQLVNGAELMKDRSIEAVAEKLYDNSFRIIDNFSETWLDALSIEQERELKNLLNALWTSKSPSEEDMTEVITKAMIDWLLERDLIPEVWSLSYIEFHTVSDIFKSMKN